MTLFLSEWFNPKEFIKFRHMSLVELAIAFAMKEDVPSLQKLFEFHRAQVQPYILQILAFFPEHTPPSLYKSLIPDSLDGNDSALKKGAAEEEESDTEGLQLLRSRFGSVLSEVGLPEDIWTLHNDTYLVLQSQSETRLFAHDYPPILAKAIR